MSHLGQSRHFEDAPTTSGLLSTPDTGRLGEKSLCGDIAQQQLGRTQGKEENPPD